MRRFHACLGFLLLSGCAPEAGPKCGSAERHVDADGDGYGNPAEPSDACDAVTDASDCADADADAHPGADERCNGRDDDCDGEIDEAAIDAATWYPDGDDDGYGAADAPIASCAAPPASAANDADCDDDDDAVHPGADERCDGRDEDCDGGTDEDPVDAPIFYADADGDGYGELDAPLEGPGCTPPAGASATAGDCDDTNAAIRPGAPEDCATEADDDCDGVTDDPESLTACYDDDDDDGWGDEGTLDHLCVCPDGWVDVGGDCADQDPTRNPDAVEQCDARDEDCDGTVDEDPVDPRTWYADADGDGYGDVTSTVLACDLPAGCAMWAGDCDDGDASAHPWGTEVCDGVDQDCDGVADDDAADLLTAYTDADGDGYGDDASASEVCSLTAGLVTAAGDCDDTDAAVSPAAADTWGDGADSDCDGFDSFVESSAADAALYGVAIEDNAGVSVSAAGDVDADGYDDVWVGARKADAGGYEPGAAYLVRGPLSGTLSLSAADGRVDGVEDGGAAGYAVDGLGDGDGDGVPDVVIAAPSADAGGSTRGAAYVLLGGSLGSTSVASANATFYGLSDRDHLGIAAAWLGDLDGDGTDDLLLGAAYTDSPASDAGSAYLALGPFSGSGTVAAADAEIRGEGSGYYLGYTLAALGDLDGDGTPDFVVGAMNADAPWNQAGSVYVYSGAPSGTIAASADAAATICGAGAGDRVGYSVAGPGDLDGDGYADLLVGASGAETCYVFTSGVAGTVAASSADSTFVGNGTTNTACNAARGIGDFDGNGTPDIAVGDAGSDDNGTNAGAAYLFLSISPGTRLLDDADGVVAGAAGDELAHAIAGVGDTDGDGRDDLLVASYDADTGARDSGGAWLLLGR